MSTAKTTAVLFDAYGTLFQNQVPLWGTTFDAICREQRLGASGDSLYKAWRMHDAEWRRARIDGDFSTQPPFVTYFEAWHECFQRAFHDLDVIGDAGSATRAVVDALAHREPYPDARQAVPLLQARSRTGILSNADDSFLLRALDGSGFSFETVLTSEQGRMYKPDPGLFTQALELIGVGPAEALYVGDTPEEDVLGAKLAGMRVAWVNRGKAWKDFLPAPDYEISKLTDLTPILDGSAGEAQPGRGVSPPPTYQGGEISGHLRKRC